MMPRIKLDGGEEIVFGQDQRELETLFSRQAVDMPIKIARKGIDQIIELPEVILRFDTGRLKAVEFKATHQFLHPLEPYAEAWKNFNAIGDKKISAGMSREAFTTYLTAWQDRADAWGIGKSDSNQLTDKQYVVELWRGELSDMVAVNMGPTRLLSSGWTWSDGWTIFFTMNENAPSLKSLAVFCDQFNTMARPKPAV